MEKTRLRLGISTCPNDTFIYQALLEGLPGSKFDWDVVFADVQTLNEMVMKGELDVAKVSARVYPEVEADYRCLHCGGAIGYGCGPLLLSSSKNEFVQNEPTALPGANTTAALLFKFWFRHEFGTAPDVRYALFNEVYQSLLAKTAVQGVTIHEHRFTWKRDGLFLIQDLGAYWEEKTQSPIPLGISVMKREFSPEMVEDVEQEIRRSLKLAWDRPDPVTPFIQKMAQIEDREVVLAHIRMFVNDFSMEVGEAGKRALEVLWGLK